MSDERYLRLGDVLPLLDLSAWYDDARNKGHLGVDEVGGAQWMQSWINEKIAGLDWVAGRAVQDDGLPPLDEERLAVAIKEWGRYAGVGYGTLPTYWTKAAHMVARSYLRAAPPLHTHEVDSCIECRIGSDRR